MQVRLHPPVFSDHGQRLAKDLGSAATGGHDNPIVDPLSFASRGNNAGTSQVCQVTRNFGLALPENLDKVANAHLSSIHQVQQPEPGAIRERSEEKSQIVGFRRAIHILMIYALTDMSRGEYIRFNICEEA